jgi:quinoprotein glucose dehydrogenase
MRFGLLFLLLGCGPFSALAVNENATVTTLLLDCEGDGYGDWEVSGDAFGLGPSVEMPPETEGKVEGFSGNAFASSAHGGPATTGSLTSPSFEIQRPYLSFRLGGSREKVGVALMVAGKKALAAPGKNSLAMHTVTWEVADWQDQEAVLRIFDNNENGSLVVDHIIAHEAENPDFPPATREGQPDEYGLVATEVLPGMKIPEGMKASIFANHEDEGVTSPTALTVAEDGRLYIAETHRFRTGVRDNRNHLYWILDDIASTSVADRMAMHEKWQAEFAFEELTEESEVIRTLQDLDGDGKAEVSKVFAEDFDDPLDGTAAGIMAYEGTVYFACIPAIYALEDRDGDGAAEHRTIVQDGFGTRVSLSGHDLNGFALGPDGRIYGTIGDRSLNLTTREGVHYELLDQGAIFRFEPDGSNFEIIHTGLRNPKEIAFNEFGDAFTVDNNADMGDEARIVQVVAGADSGWRTDHQNLHTFHRQIGLEEQPPIPWMDDRMWETKNDQQPAWLLPPLANLTNGPSGLAYHPGTPLGGEGAGLFYICDYKGGASASGVWSFGLEQSGARYEMNESGKFVWGLGATDIDFDYQGHAYITDFVEGWESAQQGRVLSLQGSSQHPQAEETATLMREGFHDRKEPELAELLSHPDQRIRLRAQLALEQKPHAIAHFYTQLHLRNELLDLASEHLLLPPLPDDDEFHLEDETTPLASLHAIWGLANLARRDNDPYARAALVGLLGNDDPELRAQAAKALGETTLLEPAPLIAALGDSSDRVAFFAALSLGRLRVAQAFQPLLALAIRAGDEDSPYLRHAAVVGLSGCASPDDLTSLSSHVLPPVRLAALLALRRLHDSGVSRFLFDFEPRIRREAIRIIHATPIESARLALVPVVDELMEKKEGATEPLVWRRLIHSLFRLGTVANAERLFEIAKADFIPLRERRESLRLLAQWTEPFPVDQSLGRHAPLKPRPLSEIRPLIEEKLGPLITADSPLLAEAVALIARYQVTPENLDETLMADLIRDSTLPTSGRTALLHLLAEKGSEALLAKLSEELLAKTSAPAPLRLEALRLLVASKPSQSFQHLTESLQDSERILRQGAAELLQDHPNPESDPLLVDYLNSLGNKQQADESIALEMLTGADRSTDPTVKEALARYRESIADDPLGEFLACLQGGDPGRGGTLFQTHPAAQCARCHLADHRETADNMAGPHLAGIGRKPRRYLLGSLLQPSAAIASGFAPISLTLTNGETLAGTLLARTPEHIDLRHRDETLRILKEDITAASEPASPMPAMKELVAPSDLRDLVAYLATLEKPVSKKKPLASKPKRYHPSPKPSQPENTAMAIETTPQPEPAENATADAAATSSSGPPEGVEQSFWDLGKKQYTTPGGCVTCHQADGKGLTGAFPPLAESEWANGPVENLIRIQLRGLKGSIEVDGQTFNSVMPPMAQQTDEQIAAVLTYVRNSFENEASPVKAEQVTELRSKEEGQPMLTVKDLVDPATAAKETADPNKPIELAPAMTASLPDVNTRMDIRGRRWHHARCRRWQGIVGAFSCHHPGGDRRLPHCFLRLHCPGWSDRPRNRCRCPFWNFQQQRHRLHWGRSEHHGLDRSARLELRRLFRWRHPHPSSR